jgi:Flp pilus assembly protein TadG
MAMFKRLMRRMYATIQRFEKSERGVAAIEFALLAPPFFLILGAIMETGLMLFSEYTIQESVQEAARLVRTGQVQAASMTATDFKNKICNTVSTILNCTTGVTVYVRSDSSFQNLAANLPNILWIGPSINNNPSAATCYNPGLASQPAAVVATYDWYFNMLGMSYMGNIANGDARRMVGLAIFQNEPFPTTGTTAC